VVGSLGSSGAPVGWAVPSGIGSGDEGARVGPEGSCRVNPLVPAVGVAWPAGTVGRNGYPGAERGVLRVGSTGPSVRHPRWPRAMSAGSRYIDPTAMTRPRYVGGQSARMPACGSTHFSFPPGPTSTPSTWAGPATARPLSIVGSQRTYTWPIVPSVRPATCRATWSHARLWKAGRSSRPWA